MKQMGRPKIVWGDKEYEQIENLCGIHCTAAEISGIMSVSEETLNRLIKFRYNLTFSEFFKRFSAKGKVSLRRIQFKMAEHNPTMALWLGKQYLGQTDCVPPTTERANTELANALMRAAKEAGGND